MALDYVHHNLQTGRVCVREGGQPGGARLVTIDAAWALVRDARPNVSAASWKRSRTAAAGGGPKRSVHADIRGTLAGAGDGGSEPVPLPGARRITYNPNRHEPGAVPVFHFADTGEEWTGSALVLVKDGYAWEATR